MVSRNEVDRRSSEFSSPEKFIVGFKLAMAGLSFLEDSWRRNSSVNKPIEFEEFRRVFFASADLSLSDVEKELFLGIFSLFSLKHGVEEKDEILLKMLEKESPGKVIGFIGPLGVGKTTMARALIRDLQANFVVKEPYEKNPFWQKSFTDPTLMFRSQLYFLLSNIYSDINARLQPGISISDTSTLTDILMWVNWYHQNGRLTDEEYDLYQQLVKILKPIIPKPDLLISLIPDSIDHLKEGIRRRQQQEPKREGELVFTAEDNPDLKEQTRLVLYCENEIGKVWQISVHELIVNPLEAYQDPSISYDLIYQIRRRLGLLKELLNPPPEKVVEGVIQILAPAKEGQIIIIHSKSMFSGKTTAECLLAERLGGGDKVIAFQPRAAIRSNESGFEGQEKAIISRDGLRIAAQTIIDNSLQSVIKYIEENNITPETKPYIFIDEVMLFVAHQNNPQEALEILEELRKKGFHLIVDGIDYTFAQQPFTFMLCLLNRADNDKNWHQIETSTRCRYCDKPASGTRLWLVDEEGQRKIAPRDFNWQHPGSLDFEPVCCSQHKSCE